MTGFDVTGIAQRTIAGIGSLVQEFITACLRPAAALTLATVLLDPSRSKADLSPKTRCYDRSPDLIWAAQQFRTATAGSRGPRWIVRDNDGKYGSALNFVAEASGTEVIRTPFWSLLGNSVCERFIGSARRECLDHMLIFGERQLLRIIKAFVDYFNRSRPHHGIGQGIPCGPSAQGTGEIVSEPVLNGLHHEY